ncbi:MAG: hypothetical protein MJD61_17590 [Proteobacteria bacterium]|nr:hypothetical protein [Pseudomonadota bacterium]
MADERCISGVCTIVDCFSNRFDCDGIFENGCESTQPCFTPLQPPGQCPRGRADCDFNGTCNNNLMTQESNCGACGNVCAFNNGTGRCVSGICRLVDCNGSWLNCDGNPFNGCETPENQQGFCP